MAEPKFKVGDRFKVVRNADDEYLDSFVGETGIITSIGAEVDETFGRVYWVSLDDPDAAFGNIYFYETELEVIEND